MSELKTSPPNEPVNRKPIPAPRSTKTSRAREIYLQKQASSSSSTSSTPITPLPKTVVAKAKISTAFKATPTPSYLSKKVPGTKSVSSKSSADTSPNKETKNDAKPVTNTPQPTQGDMAEEDFEIVQINEIKDHHSPVPSPGRNKQSQKLAADLEPQLPPQIIEEKNDVIQTASPTGIVNIEEPGKVEKHLISENVEVYLGPPALDVENPCDAVTISPANPAIEELENKLEERENDIIKLEELLKTTTTELKHLENEYSCRLDELSQKLNESEQRLERCVEECNQHKFWVDNTENQLSTMRMKFFESEQKMMAQEEDLRRLLRWSNIKNASIVTCAATAMAYYHVKK